MQQQILALLVPLLFSSKSQEKMQQSKTNKNPKIPLQPKK